MAMMRAAASQASAMIPSRSVSTSCMGQAFFRVQPFAGDEQRRDRTSLRTILAKHQFVQRFHWPWHHVELLGFVAWQAMGIQVAREHEMGLVAHVAGREADRT